MEEYFKERDIKSNVKKLKEVFNIISLTRKYKVIGSSNLKNIRYNSDFDLADFYENSKPSIKKIVKYFQKIYRIFDKKISFTYITDFKCGVNDEGQPLKWTKEEVKNNKKKYIDADLDDRYITLDEAIQQKSTIKIDVVSYINNTFIEISENYYIKIGGVSNFEESEINEKKIIESIQQSEKDEIADNNYNKALKRNFSWRYAKNKNDKKLIKLVEFFNSDVGILNKVRSDLDVLILLLEKNIGVKMDQLKNALDNIKFQQSYNTIEDFTNDFLKLLKMKNKKMLYFSLINLREKIYNLVNQYSKSFYKKNIK